MGVGSVAVILGAGASSGCVGPFWVEKVTPAAQPPLTAQIFHDDYGRFLAPYRDASMLVSTIKGMVSGERPLEAVLREFSEAPQPARRAQFLQLPLYLRDLFTWVTDTYTENPPNYSRLAHELLDAFERVVFVTLNYDGLLEKVIGVPSYGGPIRTIDDYYSRPRWLLAKLHGSIGWVRQSRDALVPINIAGGADNVHYLTELAAIGFRHQSVDDVFSGLVTVADGGNMMASGYLYYPALVVPVEGKYGFTCPPPIIAALEDALQQCSNVLIVGASGKDADLTTLLARRLPRVVNYYFVAAGSDVTAAAQRFVQSVPQLRTAAMADTHGGGFTGFLQDGFSEFLANARLIAGE